MKRLLCLLLCAAVLLTGLSGCGKKDQSYVMVLPRSVACLDPQTATGEADLLVIGSIFEGLCRVSPESEAIPGVARRWEHNRDCTVFTFHLRRARWSDGSAVTAADFVYGITRALDPARSTATEDVLLIRNARGYHNGEVNAEELGVLAKDDRTLTIELEYGYPDFPLLTAGARFMPCQESYFLESAGHYGLTAAFTLTNGPFTFPSIYAWDTDYNERKISLTRAEEYRGEHAVTAGSLTCLIDYEDSIDAAPIAALRDGTVDVLSVTETAALAAKEAGLPVERSADGVLGLLLNPDSEALSHPRTRELFLRTLDREELLSRTGSAPEAPGIMPACVRWDGGAYYEPGESCYAAQEDGITIIIPSLLELLQRDELPAITVLCPDDETSIALANGLLVNWNRKLGTAFNMEPVPESELNYRVRTGDYQAALYTLRAGGASPYHVLRTLSSLVDPQEAQRQVTFTREAFRAAEEALRDEFVFYPLLRAESCYALGPGVSGVTVSPDGSVSFAGARKQ